MGKFRGMDTDEGWIQRRFADLQRQINENAAARRLSASKITQAGLEIANQGWVLV